MSQMVDDTYLSMPEIIYRIVILGLLVAILIKC